jgi:hypothetical protein
MKNAFVVNGEENMRKSPEFQERLRALRQSVRARHEHELANAGFFRRILLRWQIEREYRRELQKIVPSPYTLYSRHSSD